MSKYYCPYCASNRRVYKEGLHGGMICNQCGENMVELNFINHKQLFALIVTATLITPLIVMLIAFSQKSERPKTNSRIMSSQLVNYP